MLEERRARRRRVAERVDGVHAREFPERFEACDFGELVEREPVQRDARMVPRLVDRLARRRDGVRGIRRAGKVRRRQERVQQSFARLEQRQVRRRHQAEAFQRIVQEPQLVGAVCRRRARAKFCVAPQRFGVGDRREVGGPFELGVAVAPRGGAALANARKPVARECRRALRRRGAAVDVRMRQLLADCNRARHDEVLHIRPTVHRPGDDGVRVTRVVQQRAERAARG
mmetsp:Transcript_31899/g.109694  ORF Transcript_31899/g.109694 Transcript_31899/m.109694 type:complete len:228 (+) Transcript_31899:84-767(+)